MGVEFVEGVPAREQVVALYDSVGWSAYTSAPDALMRALEGSSMVCGAWDGGELVGLVRVVSDGHTIMYLQDILIHPEHQRRGLGRALAERVLERYAHVRQKVLLTDDRPEQRAFYEALGFSNVAGLEETRLNAYVRIEGAELS